MRSSRSLHVAALAMAFAGVAIAQPTDGGVGATAGSAAGSQAPATDVKPAGSSPVESADVPPWRLSPPRFAVAPFDNESGVRAFDWLVAGAPFEIAQKTEDVLGLEPAGGSRYVGGTQIPSEVDPVTAFGKQHAATWVITGWVDRPNWQLRIGITLWKVGSQAVVVAEAQRQGEVKAYHQLLGDTLAEVWTTAGFTIDAASKAKLTRSLATDLYAVNLMGRGLGHLTGALGAVNLKAAGHDLERAVFIDPKCFEAQRLLGELYVELSTADPAIGGDPKLASKAAGKFAYANDLAPEDIASLRAAAVGATRSGKHEVAKELWKRLVVRKPWDLDARFELGSALWQTGNAPAAEHQLVQVTARKPDHLPARRVLVLIHSSRSDTKRLVVELEAIAARAPNDLDIKGDLATAYGALGQWDKASRALEVIAAARPTDLALLVRVGDAKRRLRDLDGALAWYGRAAKLAPDSSMPGYSAAQALFDAGRYPEAIRAYTALQRYRDDLAAAEHALGAIAFLQNRPDDAAWYLRRAVRESPRRVVSWRALVAAELARKDARLALTVLERGLGAWPRDGGLLYLAGIAHAMVGERTEARDRLVRVLDASPGSSSWIGAARAALNTLDVGGTAALQFTPELIRPWGDAEALEAAIDRYALAATTMAAVRVSYQSWFLLLIAALGKGPYAPVKGPPVRTCPIGRIAPLWNEAQQELRRYERLGGDLEQAYRFIARHDDVGATAGLLPNARTQVIGIRKAFRTALADVGELRSEWGRGAQPELRVVGCNDKLLAAAIADPERYRLIQEDKAVAIPVQQAARAKPRATFYVDNSQCADPVDVWIDGAHLDQVSPGRRSALVADGGERTLCLIVPGGAQCGDRGTVRQVYLHDGWAATMHCKR
ncbi:MAG: tetratricopeptide repeat protein [Deltaproteobacteria bacterium]|nr:tetratricopeptide repeat protein [Deltaproteobacteria bacterium]MDQ3300981.1 tetratricopeptide repeat protein [Myxococcota bacterium]